MQTHVVAVQASVLQGQQALPDPLDLETMRNTLRNCMAFKRTRMEPDNRANKRFCRPLAAKQRCSFSSVTHVRLVSEDEGEPVREKHYEEKLSPSHSCPSFLFASWGDNVQCVVAPAPIKSTPNIADVVLQTKQADGPEQVSLLVQTLIEDAVFATNLLYCNTHLISSVEKLESLASRLSFRKLEPAMMMAAYARIQKLAIRVQEAGSVGLLPQAMTINTSHLPVLDYLLLKIHRAALAKLYQTANIQ